MTNTAVTVNYPTSTSQLTLLSDTKTHTKRKTDINTDTNVDTNRNTNKDTNVDTKGNIQKIKQVFFCGL